MINDESILIETLTASCKKRLNPRAVDILFRNESIISKILSNISHLDMNSKRSEILYCHFNNIFENPKCPCLNMLKFESFTKGYRKSCVKCFRQVFTDWDVKAASSTKKETGVRQYESFKNFLKSDEPYKRFSIEEIKSRLHHLLTFRKLNKLICYKDYIDDRDFLKSIVDETKYFEVKSNRKCIKNEFNWTNRIYNILNDLTEFPKCIMCNSNDRRFLNLYKGYNETCHERQCMAALASVNRRIDLFTDICKKVKNNGYTLHIDLSDKFNLPRLSKDRIEITCDKCNDRFDRLLDAGSWKRIFCYSCSGRMSGSSHEEKYLVRKIRENYEGEILENNKIFKTINDRNHELDIYLPDKKIAFEYNGLYWHSFGTVGNKLENEAIKKDWPHDKVIWCMEEGIQLYTIFSNETLLVNKSAIWDSKIKYIFGKTNKIHARKCKIINVSSKDSNDFLDNNHLSGETNSSIRLGLEYDGELVFIMNFSKPRFNRNYEYELVRFCNKINMAVVGGVSKLFKHFVKTYNPSSIVSYCDLKISTGKSYEMLNFKNIKTNPPSYSYVSTGGAIISRYTAESTEFLGKLKIYDETLTNSENLLNNKYRRLWDCGNMLFAWNK